MFDGLNVNLNNLFYFKIFLVLIASVAICTESQAQSAQDQYRFSEINILDQWIECNLITNERDRLLVLLSPSQAENMGTTRRVWVNKHSIDKVRIMSRVYAGPDDFRIETQEIDFNPNIGEKISSKRQTFLGGSLILSGAMLVITALVDVDDADTAKLILTGAGVGLGVAGVAAISENLNDDAYPYLETVLLVQNFREE